MKRSKKLKKDFVNWLWIFPKLLYELVLFFLSIPRYFYLFFHGLRITVDSYSKLLGGLSTYQKAIDDLFKSKLNEQKTTEIFRKLLNETIRLKSEQEKSFTALFGIFIGILALFISIIAVLLKR